ncbi:MAG: lytic murein transglycosylase [Candidatus Pacebacteria bacterium]|nr:lytic murein transglycosylase [Candidatus Paceibacterota bacterium]
MKKILKLILVSFIILSSFNFALAEDSSVQAGKRLSRLELIEMIKTYLKNNLASSSQIADRKTIKDIIDSDGVRFKEATVLAKYAEKMTGVSPALTLAIISKESGEGEVFGKGVGQCYLTDSDTGDGIDSKGNTRKRVMSPTRDVASFLEMAESLGLDPKELPVSCWIPSYSNGKPYSWGGSMGPAQFIPSTWNNFRSEAKEILGKEPNPWLMKDSFLTVALYLKRSGGVDDPFLSACRYYSGKCNASGKVYANNIMEKMKSYEEDIGLLIGKSN